ncbi:MAG: crotonase/enoyl-CoA hydratase family protein [Alphaproteobacteria bacterium]
MTYTCFDVTIEDNIAHLIMKRPEKRNSMIPEFWAELPEIVKDIDENAKARVIVISSTGPHFSAGLDLGAVGSAPELTPEEKKMERRRAGAKFYTNVSRMQEAFNCLDNARVPVIAAIQGGAIGGGVDLATACSMRYATKDAFFTIFEINIGMTADVGTFPRIVKLLPEGVVHELAYTGRRMPADEAQQVGLVNKVFDSQEDMLAGVMEVAREIASKPPMAIYGCKRMIRYARDHSTEDALDYIAIWNASFLQVEEMQEAMMANAEKRTGTFVDLPEDKMSIGL